MSKHPKKRKIELENELCTFQLVDFSHEPCSLLTQQLRNPSRQWKAFSNQFNHTKTWKIPSGILIDDITSLNYIREEIVCIVQGDQVVFCCESKKVKDCKLLNDADVIIEEKDDDDGCRNVELKVMNVVRFKIPTFTLVLEERNDLLFAILSSPTFGIVSFDLTRFMKDYSEKESVLDIAECVWKSGSFDYSICLMENGHPIFEKLISKEILEKNRGCNVIVAQSKEGFKFLNSSNGEWLHQIDFKGRVDTASYLFLFGISLNPYTFNMVSTELNSNTNTITFYIFSSNNDFKSPKIFSHACEGISMDYDAISQYIYLCTSDTMYAFSHDGKLVYTIDSFTNIQTITIDNRKGLFFVICNNSSTTSDTSDNETCNNWEIMVFS